jgi:hypothetical protein
LDEALTKLFELKPQRNYEMARVVFFKPDGDMEVLPCPIFSQIAKGLP